MVTQTGRCLGFSDGLVPLLLAHQLPLVVVGVVADPVQGDGRGQHRVRDAETLADGQRLRAQPGTQLGAVGFHLGESSTISTNHLHSITSPYRHPWPSAGPR